MRRVFVILGVLLVLCISANAYEYNASIESDYGTILAGDNITLNINVTYPNGSVVTGLSCNATLNNWLDNLSMIFNDTLEVYQVFIENTPELTEIRYDCGEGEQVFEKIVYQRWNMGWQLDKPAMRTIGNNLLLEAYEYDFGRNKISAQNCNYNIENLSGTFSDFNTTFDINFNSTGNSSLEITCNYSISSNQSWTTNVTVVEYEPKLTEATPPFGEVTASDFKLGVYDFDLDGIDDIIILGEDLRIYAGPGYNTISYQNTGFDSEYDYTAADIDSDGDGDLLLGKTNLPTQSNLTLLRYSSGFSFSPEVIYSGSNLRVFGPVNFNNDFDRDVLIVSGDENLNLSYLIGPDLSTQDNFSIVNDCENFYLLDINNDFREDIFCTRDFPSFGYTRLSVLLNDNYEGANFSEFTYNFPEMIKPQLLIADLDADGQYEIAVADNNITIYDIDFQGQTLVSINEYFHTYLLWAMGSSDLMNSHEPELHALYFDGNTTPLDNSFSIQYDNLNTEFVINKSIFFNSMTGLDIDGDNDTDVLTGYQSGNKDISLWNNSIETYRNTNLSHSFSIHTVPASAGQINSSVSDQASFYVTANASWSVADYFLRASFATHQFRNDLYDSRLNRRYYLTHYNHSYIFDTSNYDEYTVSVQPVTHAGLLTGTVTASKTNSNCVYVPNTDWTINTYCADYAGDNWKQIYMNQSSFIATNTQINWNRVNATGSDFLFNFTTDSISNSIFNGMGNRTIEFVGNITRNQSNVSYYNINISLVNTTVTMWDVSFANSSILTNNCSLYLEGMSLPENLTRYPGSQLGIYQRANVTFTDGSTLVWRSGSFSNELETTPFSSTSFVNQDWLGRVNDTLLSYTFNFDEDYAYLPNTVIISDFSSDTVIQLNATGLLEWNYSINGSHQTDFRNYTLLESIDNISNIKLSLGESVNLTLLSTENLSNLNLSSGLKQTEQGFNLTLPGTYSVDMSVGFFESPLALKDGVLTNDLNYNAGEVTGTIDSGLYEVVENVSFSVDIPQAYPGKSFDITVEYGDYFETISDTDACNISIDNESSFFENIVLGTGTHSYLIECDSPELPYVNQTGEITISDRVVLARYEMDKNAHYSITMVDGKPTVIMSEPSTDGHFSYNENGSSDTYVQTKNDIEQNPFIWIGKLLNNLTAYMFSR